MGPESNQLKIRARKHFTYYGVVTIDISYTLDGASHTVGRRKLKPDRRRWSFPQS